MPSGILHEELRQKGRLVAFPLSIILPLIASPLNIKNGGELIIGIGMFLGYEFVGRYCTPDWDCITATSDEARMINEIPILGHFLFGISSTYGSIFRKKHRSFLTHFPFVSTIVRYLFLFWWIWLEIYNSSYDLYWLIFLFIGMYVGTSMSDTVHWFADMSGFYKGKKIDTEHAKGRLYDTKKRKRK